MWHPNYPPPNLVQATNFPYFCNPPPSNVVQPNYPHQWSYSASPSVPFHSGYPPSAALDIPNIIPDPVYSGPPPSASFQNLEMTTSTIENSYPQQAPRSKGNLDMPAPGVPTDEDYEKFIDHCKSLKYNINVAKSRKNANSRSRSRLPQERSSRSPSSLSDSNSRSWRGWESKSNRHSNERSEIIGTIRHTAENLSSRSQSGSVHKLSRSPDKLDRDLKFPKSSDDIRERKNAKIANKKHSKSSSPTVTKEEALGCLRQLHEREFSEYKRKPETHPLYAVEKKRWDNHMDKKGFDLHHLAVEKEWKKYFAIILDQNLIDTWNEKEEKFFKKFGSRSIPGEDELRNSKSFSTSNSSPINRQEIYSERIQQESSLSLYSKDDIEPAVFAEEIPCGKIRMREEEHKSSNNKKRRTSEGRTANDRDRKSTKDETGKSEKSRIRTSEDRVRSRENRTRTSQVSRTRRSQENKTRKSQENRKRRSQENKKRRSQENRTRRSQERTRSSQENRTRRSQENRGRNSREGRARSQEDRTRSQEDRTRSQEDRTRSQEDRTRSQEDRTRSQEDKTRSQEDKTRSQEDKTRSQEDRTKRSKENRTRTQDRRKSQDKTRKTREGRKKSQEDKTRSEAGRTRTLKKSESQTLRNASSLVNPHSETSEKVVQSSQSNKSHERSKQKASSEKSENLISKERKLTNSERPSGRINDLQTHQHLSTNQKSFEKHNNSRESKDFSQKKNRKSNNDSTLATKSVQDSSLENRISLKSDNNVNNSVKKDSIKSRLSFETGNEATKWTSSAKSSIKDRLYIPWQDTEKSQLLQMTESTAQKFDSSERTTTNDGTRRTTEKSSISDRKSIERKRSNTEIRKSEDIINKISEGEGTRQSVNDSAISFSDIENLVIVSKSETPNGENCRKVSLKRKNYPDPDNHIEQLSTTSSKRKNPEPKINFTSESRVIDENESNENDFPNKSQEISNRTELIKVPPLTSSVENELPSIDDFNFQAEEQGNFSKNELNKELKEELANYSPHLNLFFVLSQMKDKFDFFSEPLSNLYNMMLRNHNERRNLVDCIDNDSEMLLILIKDKLTDFISNKTVSIIQQAIYLETLTSLDSFLSDLKEHREKIQSKDILDEVDVKHIAKAVRGKDCQYTINFIKEILTYQQIKFTKNDIMTLYMSVKKYQTSTEFENNLKDFTFETKIDTIPCKKMTNTTIVKSPKRIIESSPKVLAEKEERSCPKTIKTSLSSTKPVIQKSSISSNNQSIPLKKSAPTSETPQKSQLDKMFSMKITKSPVSVANVNVLSDKISFPSSSDKKKDFTECSFLKTKIRKFVELNDMSEDEKLKIYSSFHEHDSFTQNILRKFAVNISKTNPSIYITVCKFMKK